MTLRIKEIAKEKGKRMGDIAIELGMNRVSLSRIINGNPTVETLKKIADCLGVSVKDLFVDDRSKTDKEIITEAIRLLGTSK